MRAGQGLRPPSRHKDPPLNCGLDLPEDSAGDDLPSLDEDSDSSEEFEIELARAGKGCPGNRQAPPINTGAPFAGANVNGGRKLHGKNNFFGGGQGSPMFEA